MLQVSSERRVTRVQPESFFWMKLLQANTLNPPGKQIDRSVLKQDTLLSYERKLTAFEAEHRVKVHKRKVIRATRVWKLMKTMTIIIIMNT